VTKKSARSMHMFRQNSDLRQTDRHRHTATASTALAQRRAAKIRAIGSVGSKQINKKTDGRTDTTNRITFLANAAGNPQRGTSYCTAAHRASMWTGTLSSRRTCISPSCAPSLFFLSLFYSPGVATSSPFRVSWTCRRTSQRVRRTMCEIIAANLSPSSSSSSAPCRQHSTGDL